MNGTASDLPADNEGEDRIQQLLLEEYGVSGRLKRLPGENLNYLIDCGADKYVLKVASPERALI